MQLSDFGLATWGPEDRDYMISSDIVGTFGYIAPEYLMYGRVSEKIDIYSFGIVLLELLTGKEPISSKGIKGQESLAIWVKTDTFSHCLTISYIYCLESCFCYPG